VPVVQIDRVDRAFGAAPFYGAIAQGDATRLQMLDPVGEWRVRDETEVDRRRAVRVLDVDLVSAEAECSPAACGRFDVHAVYTLVKLALCVPCVDVKDVMVYSDVVSVIYAM